ERPHGPAARERGEDDFTGRLSVGQIDGDGHLGPRAVLRPVARRAEGQGGTVEAFGLHPHDQALAAGAAAEVERLAFWAGRSPGRARREHLAVDPGAAGAGRHGGRTVSARGIAAGFEVAGAGVTGGEGEREAEPAG